MAKDFAAITALSLGIPPSQQQHHKTLNPHLGIQAARHLLRFRHTPWRNSVDFGPQWQHLDISVYQFR